MALSDYIQLEYIESTGNQFIALNYIPKTLHTKYELGFMRTGISGTWNPIINSEEDVRFGIMCTTDGGNRDNYGQFHIGPANSGFKSIQFPISSNIRYDIIADKTGISLNGIKYSVSGVSDATGQWSTYINHRLRTSTTFSPEYSIGRWYYLKVYEDDNLIKNYIPAKRKSDNVLGMYEKLGDKFYTNNGTGNFIAGPIKDNITNYQKLEYIESTGTQYIELNYRTKNNTGFNIDVNILSGTGANLFGAAADNSKYPYFNLRDNLCRYSYDNGDTVNMVSFGNIDNNRHTYKFIKENNTYNYYYDNNLLGNISISHPINANWVLFSYRDTDGTIRTTNIETAKCKLYSMQIYENTTIIMNLIPVRRKSDNVLGLYDIVNNKFYINKGSGSFIAGPNKYDGSQLQQNLLEIREELNTELDTLHSVFSAFINSYTELEYIQNATTSTYINTLINGDSNKQIELKIDRTTSTTGSPFMGTWNNSCIMGEVHQSRWDFYIGGTNSSNYKSIGSINDYPTTIIITISNTNLNIKNTSGAQLYNTTYNMGNWDTNLNIHLFGRNTSSGNSNGNGIFKIYYCKIWDSNVLVRDFIPVKRKSDNVICLYDKVSKQFFTNQGTGNFIAGPEVN